MPLAQAAPLDRLDGLAHRLVPKPRRNGWLHHELVTSVAFDVIEGGRRLRHRPAQRVAAAVCILVVLLLPIPWLMRLDGRLRPVIDWRDPAVRRVFVLMLPVTLSLGLINFNLVVNTFFAARFIDRIGKGIRGAPRDACAGVVPVVLHAAQGSGVGLNALLGWWWADPLAALVIAAVAVKEGREAWRGDHCC